MSTRIEDLRRRIRDLPERRRRAGQIGKLRRYALDIRKIADDLSKTVDVRRELHETFPGASLASITGAVGNAKQCAVRFKTLVSAEPDAVDTPQAEELVLKLKGQAQAAKTGARDEWRGQTATVVNRYQKLIAAANRIHLDGVQPLVAVMARIERRATLEPSVAEVVALRRDLTSLAESVRALKLEGKGGRFLEQVFDRQGDPRLLADPEVREFLDAYKLWDEVVVVFR